MSVGFRPPDQRPYLVVRLVRGLPDSTLPGALGLALPFARTGAQVSIFFDRVELATWSADAEPSMILGYTMAHEIGHVLLRSSEHSAGSLMQAYWSRASWHFASAGLLAFRPKEAEQMRSGVDRFQALHLLPEHEVKLVSARHPPK